MKKSIQLLFAMSMFVLLIEILNVTASLGTYRAGDCVDIRTVLNGTANVNLSVYYPNNSLIINTLMVADGSRFYYNLCNTSTLGTYNYDYVDDMGNVYVNDFMVTTTGNVSSIVTILFYIGLMAVLVFFLFLSVASFIKFDNLLNRVGMIGMSYGLLIAISFIGWQMSKDFLSNATFIVDFIYLIFSILMWGVLPMLVGAFAWWLIMTMRVKEIEDLMEKGLPMDEAEQRIKAKHKSGGKR